MEELFICTLKKCVFRPVRRPAGHLVTVLKLVTGVRPHVIFRCILIQTLHANTGKTSPTEQQRSSGLRQVHPGVFTAAGSRMSSSLPLTSSQSWRRFWYFKSLARFLHGSSWPPPSLGTLPCPPAGQTPPPP